MVPILGHRPGGGKEPHGVRRLPGLLRAVEITLRGGVAMKTKAKTCWGACDTTADGQQEYGSPSKWKVIEISDDRPLSRPRKWEGRVYPKDYRVGDSWLAKRSDIFSTREKAVKSVVKRIRAAISRLNRQIEKINRLP